MKKQPAQFLTALSTAVLALGAVFGTTVRTVNLSEMVKYSDRIFYGKCVSGTSVMDPENGFSYREYRFRVLEGLKGVRTGDEVIVRQLLRLGNFRAAVPGIPQYRKGQELLLFLHEDSRLGLTSPVGMGQGIFKPSHLQSGEVGFLNSFHNKNLAYQLQPASAEVERLSVEELGQLNSGEPVPLSRFREMVEKLDRLHKRDGGAVK